jgi:hypothetical protein
VLDAGQPDQTAFLAEGLEVGGSLKLTKFPRPPVGHFVLTGAKAGQFIDNPASRPLPGGLGIAGFTYGKVESEARVETIDATVADRLSWIELQSKKRGGYAFDAFDVYQKTLLAVGYERQARHVAIEKQRAMLKHADLGMGSHLGRKLLGLTTDFGYRTVKILWLYVPLMLFATVAYEAAFDRMLIRPDKLQVSQYGSQPNRCPADHPCFHGAIYAAELSFPFFDFGIRKTWRPYQNKDDAWSSLTQYLVWINIVLGWFLSGVVTVSIGANLYRK